MVENVSSAGQEKLVVPEKGDLFKKSTALRGAIAQLKQQLTALSSRKHEIYTLLGEQRSLFRITVDKIKELKQQRDKHTASVKDLKMKRESAASQTKTAVEELKKLREEKVKKTKDLGFPKPLSRIAEEIEQLEFKVETTALPFEREQKITKVIKEKKALLKRAEQLTEVVGKLKESSHKLHASKAESDLAHQELQLHASVSQKLHEEMLGFAKRADEIKATIRQAEAELATLLKEYAAAKEELQQKLSEMVSISKDLTTIRTSEQSQRKTEQEQFLAQKEKELSEKMKSGKKLTTEDLLMLREF